EGATPPARSTTRARPPKLAIAQAPGAHPERTANTPSPVVNERARYGLGVHRSGAGWVTRLPRRIRPRAIAWHRRGVAVTFRLHDRALSNRRSRRLYAASRPSLDATQRRIVDELAESGYSTAQFDELFTEPDWRLLERQSAEFVDETESDLDRLRQR